MKKLSKSIQAAREVLNIHPRIGYLGRGDGTGEVHDRDKPGRYWVRLSLSSAPVSLPCEPNANVPMTDGLAVEIGKRKGRDIILRASLEGLAAAGINPAQLNPSDDQAVDDVQKRIFAFSGTSHGDTVNKPFTAVILPGWLDVDGVPYFYPGAEFDLTSLLPASGDHAWASVFVKTDLTLEAFASTPIDVADPLTDIDIQQTVAAMTAGSLRCWAWELRGDDTALTTDPARQVDLRQIVGGSGGGGGGSVTGGANIGTAGTGVFSALVGSVLQFFKLNSLTSAITIALDSPNNKVDIDFDPLAVDLNEFGGVLELESGGLGNDLTGSGPGVLVQTSLGANVTTETTLALARGGTHANLSATGPGALVQASSGANVTAETLAATRGGTAQSTYTKGDTLWASAANTLSKLGVGTAGQYLRSATSSVVQWATVAFSELSGNATEAQGGTNQTTYTKGDTLWASAANTLSRLGVGTAGQYLRSATSSVVQWATVAFSELSGNATEAQGGTNQTSYAKGDILWASAANTLSKLAVGAAGTFLKAQASSVVGWASLVSADITDLATTLGAYITKATLTAKGDIISASASATPSVVAIGANDTIFTADSAQTSGNKWSANIKVNKAEVLQDFYLEGDISPAALTGSQQDNYAPSGIGTATRIRQDATTAATIITGITTGADGRVLILDNIGVVNLVLAHDVTSTAANRFLCPGSVNVAVVPNSSALLVYDATDSRWRVKLFDAGTDVQLFTANGTWTKRPGVKAVEVIPISGGGGGGGGTRQNQGVNRRGGGGGGGGGKKPFLFRASDLTDTVPVTIGAGGIAGLGATAGSTAGGDGGPGGDTSFGAYAKVRGGSAGIGGSNVNGSGSGGTGGGLPDTDPALGVGLSAGLGAVGGSAVNGSPGENGGGGGGSGGGNLDAGTNGAGATEGAGGGGGGGGSSTTNGTRQPGAGGAGGVRTTGTGGAAGVTSATPTTPATPADVNSFALGGTGGGGGGGFVNTTASGAGVAGAPGSLYGGGGGGGGAGTGTGNGGNGGAGANGACIVLSW